MTNLSARSPNNIHSIFIEGVYDTSNEVVPHELLWDEIQHAIVASGRFKLANRREADAVLRAQVRQSSFVKDGPRTTGNIKHDTYVEPNFFVGQSQPPTGLLNLNVADDYFTKSGWSSSVRVELWDLTTKQLILQRDYGLGADLQVYRGIPNVDFLRFEETLKYAFATSAKAIAEQLVSDLVAR